MKKKDVRGGKGEDEGEDDDEEEEEMDEETKKKLHEKYKNVMVMDQTPMGNVMLRYNVNNDNFDYWSDKTA